MLIRLEVSNFRSILEPVELSMLAIDRDRPAAREIPELGHGLLTTAAILGPNASGKSNIVASAAWLIDAVRNSLRAWDDEIPVDQFAFIAGVARPTVFVLESAIDGVRFEYILELDRDRVHYEALFHYPEKRRRRLFERDGDGLRLQRGLGSLSGTRELLTKRSLALSIARRFDEPLVAGFARDLLRTQVMGLTKRRPRPGAFGGGGRFGNLSPSRTTRRLFVAARDQGSLFDRTIVDGVETPSPEDRARALALLRLADLGIEDVQIDEQQVSYSDAGDLRTVQRLSLVHNSAGLLAPLDFSDESEGTKTWFDLIGPVLLALRQGSLLLFDELDASLHPTLSAALLAMFHDPITNPLGAQLLFTTHDTSLLNHLNRDEVWLTEKRHDGSTRLGALADFAGERVRRSQNLENAYLHGRFGGLPEVDQAAFLRALGLIG